MNKLNLNSRHGRWSSWSVVSAWTCLGIISAVCFWTVAQQQDLGLLEQARQRLGEPQESAELRSQRESSRLAVLDPVGFAAERKRHETPDERQAADVARFAISQPARYAAELEKFKGPERRALEQQARQAILNPLAHSGSADELNRQHALRKEQGLKDPDDILDPEFNSMNVPGHPLEKAPQRRQKDRN